MTFALYLRDTKNNISNQVNSNLVFYLEMKPLDFVTYMRQQYKGELSSNFDKQLYQQVIDCYQNKFDNLQNKLTFERIEYQYCEVYKKDTKKHKKGEFKKVNNKSTKTPLTIVLTYLARYGNENTVQYIDNQLNTGNIKEDKIKYYNNILKYINKFGFDRLYRLALQKRNRVIDHYSKTPIEFKSLSFSGRSRKKKIVDYNKNYNSVINSYISLSWVGRKSMDIPVKYSKDYHGLMSDYTKKDNSYDYILTFDEKRKQVNINICTDGERYIPEVTDNSKSIGIDVNTKHNLFSLSDNTTYDYDRKLVNDYCQLSTDIDNLKKRDKDYKVGKRKQHKLNTLRHKMKSSNQQLISTMCKNLKDNGIEHIVMENLDGSFGRSYIKDNNNGDINYNRIVKFLNISSLKGEVEHIGRNYGIGISTVHPSYTSKYCPICGCVEDENRPNQETFICIRCGHEDNADHNASVNIENRVGVAVLRNKLLKQLDNGTYEPKKLKRDKVRDVLLSYRTSHNSSDRGFTNYL
jgi:transposase